MDQRQTRGDRLVGLRIEHESRAGHIVEQSVEPVMEQRHPVLHARKATALADVFVERIVTARGAEIRNIGRAKLADGLRRQCELAHRHQFKGFER